MKSIAQFKVYKEDNSYIAEGIDLAIVTQADDLDQLVKNIEEAVSLHFEGENITDFDYSQKPSILVNYELPQYA
jgi:predicted RNase H-like HicB family nuclease